MSVRQIFNIILGINKIDSINNKVFGLVIIFFIQEDKGIFFLGGAAYLTLQDIV